MKIFIPLFFFLLFFTNSKAQDFSSCEQYTVFDTTSTPDLGIVLNSDDAETIWNAMRLAIYAQSKGDTVVIFLLGKGIDGFQSNDKKYTLDKYKNTFFSNGGSIIACGSCAKARGTDNISMCTITGLADLYAIIKRSKKVLTF